MAVEVNSCRISGGILSSPSATKTPIFGESCVANRFFCGEFFKVANWIIADCHVVTRVFIEILLVFANTEQWIVGSAVAQYVGGIDRLIED